MTACWEDVLDHVFEEFQMLQPLRVPLVAGGAGPIRWAR